MLKFPALSPSKVRDFNLWTDGWWMGPQVLLVSTLSFIQRGQLLKRCWSQKIEYPLWNKSLVLFRRKMSKHHLSLVSLLTRFYSCGNDSGPLCIAFLRFLLSHCEPGFAGCGNESGSLHIAFLHFRLYEPSFTDVVMSLGPSPRFPSLSLVSLWTKLYGCGNESGTLHIAFLRYRLSRCEPSFTVVVMSLSPSRRSRLLNM